LDTYYGGYTFYGEVPGDLQEDETAEAATSTDSYYGYYGDEAAAAASTDSYYYYYGDDAASGYSYSYYDYYYSYDGAATMAASVTMLFAAVHLM
jgi:hypothetical protein